MIQVLGAFSRRDGTVLLFFGEKNNLVRSHHPLTKKTGKLKKNSQIKFCN